MNATSLIQLIVLAAIWGATFVLIRFVTPVLDSFVTANVRVFLAGFLLSLYALWIGNRADWRKNARHYIVIGLLNCAIPFTLFPYALHSMSASHAALLNAMTPMFSLVLSWLCLGERIVLRKVVGLLLSVVGLTFVVRAGLGGKNPLTFFPVLACVVATFCYAYAGIYSKKYASSIKPVDMTANSQLIAALVLLPLSITHPPTGVITLKIALCAVALAVFSSGVGLLIYYRLLADIGAAKTSMVGFLSPVFAILWGALFLREVILPEMVLGGTLILFGIWLAIKQNQQPLTQPANSPSK